MRSNARARGWPALASRIAAAVKTNTDSACSVGSISLSSERRIKGWSISVFLNATRWRATCSASFRQRRIIAAARTPCDSRDRLTGAIAFLMPSATSPTA